MPLVFEAYNWNHGVYVGATMSSELTAAQYGKLGIIRHDPMAMMPFCGYNMGDYFQHWLDMGRKINDPPKIFHVNWFRKDSDGNFIWPGFGENIRVLDWIIRRAKGSADAVETPLGLVPIANELNLEGLNLESYALKELFDIYPHQWIDEIAENRKFFNQFAPKLPQELLLENEAMLKRF